MFPRRRLLLFLLSILTFYLLKTRLLPTSPPNHELTIESAYAHYGFTRGISTFQPDGLSKHLVLPCTPNDDIRWLSTLPPWLNITHKVYHIPLAADFPPPPSALTVPKNKGNEAMAYLTYIIDHYDVLPDLVVFAHASATTWHNNDLHIFTTPLMLRELNYNRAKRRGYMNLRCNWKPGCPNWIQPGAAGKFDHDKGEEYYIARVFKDLFPDTTMPSVLGATCCAQFVVTRECIRGNLREEYQAWRQWLLQTELPDRFSGRVMEYLWHYIFSEKTGRRSVDCPKEHVCYCDGYGMCFGGEGEYEAHMKRGKETAELERRLQKAVEEGPRKGEDILWREDGMRKLKEEIEGSKKRLQEEIEVARERGRIIDARRKEVGEEFSG